jgi:glucose/arabinose dehydrogenase
MKRLGYILSIAICLLITVSAKAQTFTLDSTVVTARNVITTLDVPWEILWGADGWIWTTERYGRVSRIDPDNGTQDVLADLSTGNGGPVVNNNEGGMLGMALHPDFPDSSYVYIVYEYTSGSYKERLVKFFYDGDTILPVDTLIDNITGASIHNGSRVYFTPDRKLYMTTGDASNTSNAQNVTGLNGKTLRFNLDGSVPADNPIPGSYVYNWGQRNSQGMVYANGRLYQSMHGWNSDDEINIIVKGRNYGWPTVEGYCNNGTEQAFCADSNVVEPIKNWTPTIATCGLDYYNHPAIPEWQGKLLLATLKEADLRVLRLNAAGDSIKGEDIEFNNQWGRLRDLCVSPDGRVFIANNASTAFTSRIVEIKNSNFSPAPLTVNAGTDITLCMGSAVQLNSSVSGGTGVYTYSWSPSTGLSCTTCSNPIVTGTSNTTYVLTVDDGDTTATDAVAVSISGQAPIASMSIFAIDTLINGLVLQFEVATIGADSSAWVVAPFSGDSASSIGNFILDTIALSSGAAQGIVCLQVWNDCGTDTICQPFSFAVTTGINDGLADNITVYPNPAKDVLNVKVQGLSGKGTVKLSNLNGQVVYESKVKLSNNAVLTVPVTDLPKGIYMVQLSINGQSYLRKVAVE